MTLSPFKSLFFATVAIASSASSNQAVAGVHTLWATSVPETSVPASTTPWNNESYASLAPTCTNCNTTSCQFTTNSVNGNTTPLTATDFADFSLPAGERITRVKVEVTCRYNENTSASLGFRAFAPGYGIETGWRDSPTFNTIGQGNGVVVCSDRLGSAGDITSSEANWTAAKVNNLQLQVRRQAGLNNNTLRVLALKVIVTTEPAPSVPNTPSNLRATSATPGSISLAWNDNASNETAYVLYRLNPGLDPDVPGNWTTTNLPANVVGSTPIGLAAGSTYRFYVRALNAAGLSAPSNMLAATTQSAPQAGSRFFINEIRTEGTGAGGQHPNYIEIATPAGTVLWGQPGVEYALLQYTQTGATSNNRCRLEVVVNFNASGSSATIVPNQMNGMGVVRINKVMPSNRAAWAFVRIVNGTQVQLLDFVTHRGSSSATAPMTVEPLDQYLPNQGSTAIPYSLYGQGLGKSLRLGGSGCGRNAFQWTLPSLDATSGTINIGQTFVGCP